MDARKFIVKDSDGHVWKPDINYRSPTEAIEYPWYSATIARDGSVIVSKATENGNKWVDFLIEPETLYNTLETLLARCEMITPIRADGNVLAVGEA